MEDRKQELYDRIADSVREVSEGQEAEPGSIIIETTVTQAELQEAIRDLGKPKEPKMKTSWQRIFTFAQYVGGYVSNQQVVAGWLQLHPEETKFSVGVKRVLDQVPKAQQTFQQKRADIEMANCATMHARPGDPESPKIIVRGEKGELCFTVEGDKAKQKAIETQIEVEDMEIEPYYVVELSEIPKLSAAEIEVFKGFVISPEQVESLKEKESVSGNGHIPESPVAAEAKATA